MIKKVHNTPMINMEVMYSIFGHNRAAIHDYIKNFTINSSVLLKQIKQATQYNNGKLVMDYFHQLKGPAGSSGFHKIYKLCEKAEKHVEKSDWNAVNELYCDIDNALKKLQIELDKLNNSLDV